MNKKIISLLFTSILLVGCGSSSGETSSEQTSSSEEIKNITGLTVTGFETRHTDIQLN